jgi:Domain of unknown function (DUF6378)
MPDRKKASGGRLQPLPPNITVRKDQSTSEPSTVEMNLISDGLGEALTQDAIDELPEGLTVWLRDAEGRLGSDSAVLPDMPEEAYGEDAVPLPEYPIDQAVPEGSQDAVREDLAAYVVSLINSNRQLEYGPPEENLSAIALMWTGYLGIELTANDVAALMVMLKMSRARTSPFHVDTWADCMGYALIAGSIAVAMQEQSGDDDA